MAFGDLPQALPTLAVLLDSDTIQYQWSPADALAFETSAPHAGAHSFDDQAAFKLGDSADDHDDGASQRAAGVDIFPEADIFDSCPIQLVEHIEEVLYRTGNPVRCPHQYDVEAAAAGIGHHLIEARSFGLGAADLVCVLGDDLVAALSSHLAQVVKLRLGMLIDCGDTHIERGALQARLPFGLGLDSYLAT